MLCEKCKKNIATTHIRTVVGGVVEEFNLCEKCAAEQGYTNIAQSNLAGMLASMFGDISYNIPKTEAVRCPVCNAQFADIAASGKVGCAECYKTFNAELLPYLKRVHGSTKHAGKVPNSAPLTIKQDIETIESLKIELSRLISEEKYEEAAIIRDKIKERQVKEDE